MTSQVFASLTSTNYSPKPGLLKSCNDETRFQSMKESGRSMTFKRAVLLFCPTQILRDKGKVTELRVCLN